VSEQNGRADAKQQTLRQPLQGEGAQQSERQADQAQLYSLYDYQVLHLAGLRTEGNRMPSSLEGLNATQGQL